MKKLISLFFLMCAMMTSLHAQAPLKNASKLARTGSFVSEVMKASSRIEADRSRAIYRLTSQGQLASQWRRLATLKLKGQTDSILKEALILSESTRSQIDEMQRSLYVKSQLLMCYVYRRKKDYAAAYLLAMELMKSKLTETERAEVNEAYAYNGYLFATTFARQHSTGHADYAQARAL